MRESRNSAVQPEQSQVKFMVIGDSKVNPEPTSEVDDSPFALARKRRASAAAAIAARQEQEQSTIPAATAPPPMAHAQVRSADLTKDKARDGNVVSSFLGEVSERLRSTIGGIQTACANHLLLTPCQSLFTPCRALLSLLHDRLLSLRTTVDGKALRSVDEHSA